jgi:hypothetical protein
METVASSKLHEDAADTIVALERRSEDTKLLRTLMFAVTELSWRRASDRWSQRTPGSLRFAFGVLSAQLHGVCAIVIHDLSCSERSPQQASCSTTMSRGSPDEKQNALQMLNAMLCKQRNTQSVNTNPRFYFTGLHILYQVETKQRILFDTLTLRLLQLDMKGSYFFHQPAPIDLFYLARPLCAFTMLVTCALTCATS